MREADPRQLLAQGATDAVGFLGGALLGFWLGQWFGLDIFADGYGAASLGGIALVGLGGGLGLQGARRWRKGRTQESNTGS